MYIFFFKQKTAYEMRIRDWSSDVCSSDLTRCGCARRRSIRRGSSRRSSGPTRPKPTGLMTMGTNCDLLEQMALYEKHLSRVADPTGRQLGRSEEHTSELQSLMRISYAVLCLKQKKKQHPLTHNHK